VPNSWPLPRVPLPLRTLVPIARIAARAGRGCSPARRRPSRAPGAVAHRDARLAHRPLDTTATFQPGNRLPMVRVCFGNTFAELLIDCEEDRTLWAVLVGMLRRLADRSRRIGSPRRTASLPSRNRTPLSPSVRECTSSPCSAKGAPNYLVERRAQHVALPITLQGVTERKPPRLRASRRCRTRAASSQTPCRGWERA
jgi:hypothetical protein